MNGLKTGGRTKGSLNKATRKLKAFLDDVFAEAFTTPAFRQNLLDSIVDLSVDPRVLQLLLAYWAGAPPKEHKHSGSLTLEQLVLGTVPNDDDDEDNDDPDVPAGAGPVDPRAH